MILINQDEIDNTNLEQYSLSSPIDGWIYIVLDRNYPEFVKIGRTRNIIKRLQAYNTDKPYPSTYLYCISSYFDDAVKVEKKILEVMYNITNPTTHKLEWFDIKYLDMLVSKIKDAEELYA